MMRGIEILRERWQMIFAGGKTRLWGRALVEIFLVLAVLGVCAALIFLSSWQARSVAGIPAMVIFFGLLLTLLARGILSFWRRQWLAGIVRVMAVPICLIGGVVVMFLANLAGDAASNWDFRTQTLPIDEWAMQEIRDEGNRIAAELSKGLPEQKGFVLRGIDLESSKKGEKIGLNFFAPSPSYFSLNLDFQKTRDGWKRTGKGAGGDPKTFATIRAAVEPHLPSSLPTTLPWPLDEPMGNRIRGGAENLRVVFENQGVLRTDGKPWTIRAIHYIRSFDSDCGDLVRLDHACVARAPATAWASTDWAYDGKFLRFLDATGGGHSHSTMENHAEVETVVANWLTEDRGIFERIKDQGKPWRTCEAELSGVHLIYAQQQAHPFLAEYHMRVTIARADGRSRIFSLPMNTGGRTEILVFTGTTSGGTSALRMVSGRHFDMAFDLETLRIFPVGEFEESAYAGAFLELSTPLTWFPSKS